jgi:hypothetical protein
MPKKQGDRLNIGEAKASIIEFILENYGPVGEPAIRDFLLQKYDVMDQGNINRHLHDLEKLNCIELIPPQKKGLRNYWDITRLQNLKNIRREFPELKLNMHEKSINIIFQDICTCEETTETTYWLRLYIMLFISTSYFNTCLELGFQKIKSGFFKVYVANTGSCQQQRIDDLLKVCYSAYVKYTSDIKISEKTFISEMKRAEWEHIIFYDKECLSIWFERNLPGFPEEIPRLIFKTKLSQIEEIPEKIPEKINYTDLAKYVLNAIYLLIEQNWDYMFSKDDLLLKHFFDHDILFEVDSEDEHYFVKKTIENHTFTNRKTGSHNIVRKEAIVSDLELANEILIKYKRPGKFNNFFSNLDEVYRLLVDPEVNYGFR